MRKKRNYKRNIKGDLKYDNVAVARFINVLMKDGKKSIAEKVVYSAFDILEKKSKEEPVEVFKKALDNVMPVVEVASKRVGGANYQVPREVRPERRFMLATRWMIAAAKASKGRGMPEKLAEELLLASKGEGEAMKKKQNVHRMAEANRAFAHFSW